MGQQGTQRRTLPRTLALVGFAVLMVALGAGTALLRETASPPAPAAAPPSPPLAAAVPAAPPPVSTPPAAPSSAAPSSAASTLAAAASPVPSFDVVRVGPQGSAVVAGRAAPGDDVVLLDGSREIGRARADRQGSFVVIPPAPLEPGGRSLTLAARDAAADPTVPERRAEASVMVVVPPQPQPQPQSQADVQPPEPPRAPVAVLVPDAGAPVVLQPDRDAGPVGLDTVDYGDKGGIRFTGHAAPGSTLRLYVDDAAVGDVAADGAGRWVMAPGAAVAPGLHTLRLDRLDTAGRVLARVELPFQHAALAPAELSGGRIVVQPGQNLWRMARAAYGSGVRYTDIYLANREQIRDPGLIYPGQAFSVPDPAR